MWSLSHWTTREIPFLIFDRQVLARFINHSSADTYEKYSVRFFLKDVFIYLFFFLAALGLCCCAQAFPSCGNGGYSLVLVYGHLTVVLSLVAEHGLSGTQASVVVVYRLSLPEAFGISSDQGLNPRPLYWQAGS